MQRLSAVRARLGARAIAGVVVVLIGIAVVGGIALRSGRTVGCVSVGVAFHDPRFGRTSFDRRFPCLRGIVAPVHSVASYAARRHT